ncbi:MAG: FAD-dependent oxidoreductase, partial [Bdellovibrionota bacterium]
MSEKLEADIAIIGAGVIGLAFAEALTRLAPDRTLLLIERYPKFGNEVSSHNSEVIHAGIY